MSYIKLTSEGKNYIKKRVSGNGDSFLSGKNKYVLPYAIPKTLPTYIWYAHPKHNGFEITTNSELANALIYWYEKYSKEFGLDANIIIAQAIIESGLIVWNYAGTSSASSISQFISGSAFDIILKDVYKVFTKTEKDAISKNIKTEQTDAGKIIAAKKNKTTYSAGYSLGQKNRAQMHQNMIDNPDIMIKAQCVYMKKMTSRTDLASSRLFGYNRGPDYIKSTYTATIQDCINRNQSDKNKGYEKEGVTYVWKIFNMLYNNFGYNKGDKDLKMNLSPNNAAKIFDPYEADVDSSEQYN